MTPSKPPHRRAVPNSWPLCEQALNAAAPKKRQVRAESLLGQAEADAIGSLVSRRCPRRRSLLHRSSPKCNAVVWHVDKSALPLSEPRRYRNRAHLEFVASQPCLVCGRQTCDAHHLRFMQPRALGRRVSDEFAVPLCRTHHRALHRSGDEAAWWKAVGIDAVTIAHRLWQYTRLDGGPIQEHIDPLLSAPSVHRGDGDRANPSAGPGDQ
jgi:hypothetical protein